MIIQVNNLFAYRRFSLSISSNDNMVSDNVVRYHYHHFFRNDNDNDYLITYKQEVRTI